MFFVKQLLYVAFEAIGEIEMNTRGHMCDLVTNEMQRWTPRDLVQRPVMREEVKVAASAMHVTLTPRDVDVLVHACAAIVRAVRKLDRGEINGIDVADWVWTYASEPIQE